MTAAGTPTGGTTVWLTGLPSAGKSTIARRVAEVLGARGRPVQVLDGDEVRTGLCADLGFSRADRDANVLRIGYVAELLARHGVVVLVPVIAPYAAARTAVREHHARHGTPFLEGWVTTPVRVCADRDVKGLFARQRAGTLTGLTGVDDPYEQPRRPDIRIDTTWMSVDESAELVLSSLCSASLVSGVPRT